MFQDFYSFPPCVVYYAIYKIMSKDRCLKPCIPIRPSFSTKRENHAKRLLVLEYGSDSLRDSDRNVHETPGKLNETLKNYAVSKNRAEQIRYVSPLIRPLAKLLDGSRQRSAATLQRKVVRCIIA